MHKGDNTNTRFIKIYLITTLAGILAIISINIKSHNTPTTDFNGFYSINEIMNRVNTSNGQQKPLARIKTIDNIGEWINHFSEKIYKYNPISKIYEWIDNYKCKSHINAVKRAFYELHLNSSTDFIAFSYHSIYKPLINGADLPLPEANFSVDMAKGEYESFQILIYPSNTDLKDIQIKIDKSEIPLSCCQVYEAGWVNCRPPVYSTPHKGWYIDPLLSLQYDSIKNCFSSKIYNIIAKQNSVSSIWINILAPEKIKSGIYPVELTLSGYNNSGKRVSQQCEVKVHIFNVSFPREPTIKTAFSFNWELYMWYYNILKFDFSERKKIYDFFFSYRINPVELNRFGKLFPPIEDWDYMAKKGARAFCIGTYRSENDTTYYKKFDTNFRSDLKQLKNNPLKKYAFLFGFDEMNFNYHYSNRATFKKMFSNIRNYVNRVDKTIPIAGTAEFNEEISEYFDWWMSINTYYSPEMAKKCVKPNQELWWSTTMSSTPPYPTFFIDANAIEPRVIFWQGSKCNINGFKYYETILWQSNICWEKGIPFGCGAELNNDKNVLNALHQGIRWPEIPWNSYSWTKYSGDGMLIYPGKNKELLPSIRLLNIRDGIEDFELLNLLKVKVKNHPENKELSKLLNELYNIVPNQVNYQNNPSQLIENKRKLLKALEP